MFIFSRLKMKLKLLLRAAYSNLLAFFSDDSKQAEIDALEATIARLEYEKTLVCNHLSHLRFELTRARQR